MTGRGAPPAPAPRRRATALMLGSFVAGVLLMVLFEAVVTRVLGVALLFTFIVSGVFLIADPAFLDREDDEIAPERPPRAAEE
jgi:hypothetical protein